MARKACNVFALRRSAESALDDCNIPKHVADDVGAKALLDGMEHIHVDALQPETNQRDEKDGGRHARRSQISHTCRMVPQSPAPRRSLPDLGICQVQDLRRRPAKRAHVYCVAPTWYVHHLGINFTVASQLARSHSVAIA